METAGQARGRRLRAQGARHQQWRRRAADEAVLESCRLSAQRRRNRSRHGGMRGMIMRYRILLALTVTASLGFAAAIHPRIRKKAKMRYNMPLFCRNGHAVCATQSATTRVS